MTRNWSFRYSRRKPTAVVFIAIVRHVDHTPLQVSMGVFQFDRLRRSSPAGTVSGVLWPICQSAREFI